MNNKKNKTLFVVLGVFALVIVTTAASFAFFTYSRTGETTTTITSGDIEFSFIEGSNASLVNAFPVSDSVGAGDTTGEYTFDVKMKSSSSTNRMTYNVYLLDDNGESGNYFKNNQIKFSLVKNGTYVANTSSSAGVKLSDIEGFEEETSSGEGLVLENQEISANVTDNYKLRIWISDDVVYSNDIDENGSMTGKYNSYTYSLKVKVTSGVETTTTVSEPVGRTIVANLADNNGLSAYAVTTSSESSSVTDWTEITSETAKSNVVRTATGKVTSKKIQYKVDSYGTYYLHVKNTLNEITTVKVDVKIKEVAKDTSGAATPVIKGNLVPVIMNGYDVIKADTSKGWYNYDQAIWANAVILTDDAPTYNNGDMIDEQYIESYFVWIPRYEYKIFDEGNYTDFGEKKPSEQQIEIRFVDKEDAIQNGSTVGTWLTHPAFTSFDSNGMWIGKFESGYKGATSTTAAQVDSNDKDKLIIKPNTYSWRNIELANAYLVSYNYDRTLDSHLIKNTEWGAVAYLQHSKYGSATSVRNNNNKSFITGYAADIEPTKGHNGGTSIPENTTDQTEAGVDGVHTMNYMNIDSVVASTTGNYSGVYDMSGGVWEVVMGVVEDTDGKPFSGRSSISNSGFQGKYGCPACEGADATITENTDGVPFPTDRKYYDLYPNESQWNRGDKRILGDATGEMGPMYLGTDPSGRSFGKSSWYDDRAVFVNNEVPWFMRGGIWLTGCDSGVFAYYYDYGSKSTTHGFRTILTPQ